MQMDSASVIDDPESELTARDQTEGNEEESTYDTVCAICDDGGCLLSCKGVCKRSFHATEVDGNESHCRSLGYTKEQVAEIKNFVCKNCEYKQHQCYICGDLGSSDVSSGAEVFNCNSSSCGHFYHPKCVAALLFPNDKTKILKHEKRISAGLPFTCPMHKCCVCEDAEGELEKGLVFAICRRCPTSYHQKCLPSNISFSPSKKGAYQRAWRGLLPNDRILIYCWKHKIDEGLCTPVRNHVIFPDDALKAKRARIAVNPKIQSLTMKNKKGASEKPCNNFRRGFTKLNKEIAGASRQPEMGRREQYIAALRDKLLVKSRLQVDEATKLVSSDDKKEEEVQDVIFSNTIRKTPFCSMELRDMASHAGNPKYESSGKVPKIICCYAKDGDVVAYICCSTSDLGHSIMEKLYEVGKRCELRSYKVEDHENKSNTEKKDELKLQLENMPTGSKLIVAFDVRGVRQEPAELYITEVMAFKPKLVLLFSEVDHRLDQIISCYEQIWADIEVPPQQPPSTLGLNASLDPCGAASPSLCLWSRVDWSSVYKEVARRCGHIPKAKEICTEITSEGEKRRKLVGSTPSNLPAQDEVIGGKNDDRDGDYAEPEQRHEPPRPMQLPQTPSAAAPNVNDGEMAQHPMMSFARRSLYPIPGSTSGWLNED